MESLDKLSGLDKFCNDSPVGLLQSRWELKSMLSIVLSNTKLDSFLEIGTFYGGSLYVMLKYLSQYGSAFVIDVKDPTFQGDVQDFISTWKGWVSPNQNLDVIYKSSHDQSTIDEFSNMMLGRGIKLIDFLFIDGDHSYSGVVSDYTMYSKFVRPGGIIGFHDISENGPTFEVPRAWKDIRRGKRYAEIVEHDDYMGIGLIVKE